MHLLKLEYHDEDEAVYDNLDVVEEENLYGNVIDEEVQNKQLPPCPPRFNRLTKPINKVMDEIKSTLGDTPTPNSKPTLPPRNKTATLKNKFGFQLQQRKSN